MILARIFHASPAASTKGLIATRALIHTDVKHSDYSESTNKYLSRIANLTPIEKDQLHWYSNEDNPLLHNKTHFGLYYKLPNATDRLVKIFGMPSPYDSDYDRIYQVINMRPIMIRQPAFKTLDYLKRIDYENSENVRILLYGDNGRGKSMTLFHILHYLQESNFQLNNNNIIFHVKDMKKFTIKPTERATSTSRKSRIDTPFDSAIMLQKFKLMNGSQLTRFQESLVSSQKYNWSSKEVTEKGEPLINIIEHGVNRVSHASDCLAVLIKELMLAADTGVIKLISLIDDIQFLYLDSVDSFKHEDKKRAYIDEITVARALRKLVVSKCKSSALVATIDDKRTKMQNLLPDHLLGERGWKAFDPFLPIEVPVYSRLEFESNMNFLQDVGWLQRPEACTVEARAEIRFCSGMNPREISNICRSL